jgi:hypothetical protein
LQDVKPPQAPAASHGEEACVAEVVKQRARAGLVTILVAVVVAAVTLAGAAATLLVTGLIPLSGLEGRIANAIEERLGRDWKVEASSAELGRIDGRSQLRVRQVSFRHKSGATFRAPEAVLGYEPLPLLRGDIRLVSVDLRGVNIRLGVDRDGALVMSADEGVAVTPPPVTLPDAGHWDAFTGIMGAVSTLAQNDGLLGALETVGIHGARLVLVDPQGRQKAGYEDVDIGLARTEAGRTRLTLKGRSGARWKELAIELSTAPDGTQRADLELLRFEPAEVMSLAMGASAIEMDGLPVKGTASLTQKPDGTRGLSARFEVLPGTIRFPGSPIAPVSIDSGMVEIESGDSLKVLHLRHGALHAGATQMRGTGVLRDENGAWRLQLDMAGALAGEAGDPPVPLDRLTANLLIDPRSGEVQIDSFAARGPSATVDATGYIQRVGDSPTQRLSVRATQTDARAALAIWPRWTSPELHTALSRQLVSGRIASVQVDLDLPADDHARMIAGAGMPDGALVVTVDAHQVRFEPAPGLPPLIDATVSGRATGRTVQLAIAKATADLGGGRQLALSEGSFGMAETWIERAPARVAFRATGPMESLAALLAFPALREFSPGAVDPASLRGNVDLRSVVLLPMADDPKPGEVVVQTSGTLTGIASDTLLGSEKLDGGNLTVSFDRTGLLARGEARIGGDRGQVELRQNSRGQGEATISLTLDNAARQKRGLGPEAGITGPVQARVIKQLGRNADAPPRVELELSKAAIDGAIPGFSKAAGRPGKASFSYIADPDGPDLDDFVLDAPPALIRGKIELTRQNGFESAALSQMRLSPGDNLTVQAQRDGNLTKLVIRGAVADVRPFIRDLQSASGPPARGEKAAAKGGDLDIDLAVPILTGFNSEQITNGVLKLSKRGGELRSLSFQGALGRAEVTARQGRVGDAQSPLSIKTSNGGALLRFVDIYRRAYGGELDLDLGPGEARQSGELLFRNFVVRDEPALRRVVGAQAGGAPAGDRADGAAAAGQKIDVGEVAFTKLRAEFTRSASRLDVSDMVIWGQQVGFTLQGNVDYGRDRVDIGGTYVPGYAFNNAFAQVPVLGALLGGGSQYGGLFAVNFRISGSASAPTMSINPLSALAPGILRRFVDPLGGAPERRPIQPGEAAPPTR